MGRSDLQVEVEDHIAVVTMVREPVNALSPGFRRELIGVFDALGERDDVRVVVLTSGLDVFSAGADLKAPPPRSPGDWGERNRLSRETKNSIIECSKPVIAAINGPAIGAGFGLAGACDILVASEGATFAMTEIDVGLAGGASLLRQYLGRSRMRRMILTGMSVDAEELYRLGVVEACVPSDELMPTAMSIARQIADKSPTGIKYAKRSLNLVELMAPRDAYRFEQDYTVDLASSPEVAEIRAARREGRSPRFGGKPAPGGPTIGLIGLGAMGSGLAASSIRASREVVAFDVAPGWAERAQDLGVGAADGAHSLLEACDVILLVLPDDSAVEAVVAQIAEAGAAGKLVIDCSTVSPATSRHAAERLRVAGAGFADAGMGGGTQNAADGTLLFMVGCEEEAWARVEEVLHPIARGVIRCGSVGAGVTMKAITNLLWLANYRADVEALIFAKSAGIDTVVATSILGDTGAANRALGMTDQLVSGSIAGGFPVRLAVKDLEIAMATAREAGLELDALVPALEMYREAADAGWGELGVAVGGRVAEQRHGIHLDDSAGDDPDGSGGG